MKPSICPRDGLISIKRGVADLDMGENRYNQVRIGVDGTHYLKGMAVYADDLPDGVDIRVNSNKPSAKGYQGALKEQKRRNDSDDPNVPFDTMNPFGTNTKEDRYLKRVSNFYEDPKTGEEKEYQRAIRDEQGNKIKILDPNTQKTYNPNNRIKHRHRSFLPFLIKFLKYYIIKEVYV